MTTKRSRLHTLPSHTYPFARGSFTSRTSLLGRCPDHHPYLLPAIFLFVWHHLPVSSRELLRTGRGILKKVWVRLGLFLIVTGIPREHTQGKKRGDSGFCFLFVFCLHMFHGRRVGHASVCIYSCLERPGARAAKGCSGTANCLVQGKVGVAEYCESNKLNQRLETCFGGATVHAALTLRGSGTWQHME